MFDEHGREIGGAAFCRKCRARTQQVAREVGLKIEPETCFGNKAVPGPAGCIAPAPELLSANRSVWDLFVRSSSWRGAINYRGMDGEPAGRKPCCVKTLADGLEIPWDERTIDRFQTIESEWLAMIDRQMEERERERKAKAGR